MTATADMALAGSLEARVTLLSLPLAWHCIWALMTRREHQNRRGWTGWGRMRGDCIFNIAKFLICCCKLLKQSSPVFWDVTVESCDEHHEKAQGWWWHQQLDAITINEISAESGL